MQNLLKNGAGTYSFKIGKNVKGIVADADENRILIELPGGMTGIIPKKEQMGDAPDVGVEIEASIIDDRNDEGLVVLSLKRASQDMVWAELGEFLESDRILKVKIEEANRGGLMGVYKGLKAFLPVSQLMPVNYPRVDGADASVILKKLESHVGSEFAVKILNADRESGKLIISEKAAHAEQAAKTLETLQVGDQVQGEVSGIVKFGIFVTFGGVEGLVHLSELDWGLVSNVSEKYAIGDKVEVQVIGIDGSKLSLSIKRLQDDPWIEIGEQYQVGQTVSGPVIRWNSGGVFVQVESDVLGCFALSEFGVESSEDLEIKPGDELSGKILDINFDAHRLDLEKVD